VNIAADFLNSELVNSLCDMYVTEYTPRSFFRKAAPSIPSILNAIGACAGFAAQAAVWREMILPTKRNAGDFLVSATTKSGGTFFFGEAINLFLFATMPDRLSFLSVAGAALSSAAELPDIAEIARRVSQSLGSAAFGRPRVPPSIELVELPVQALGRTWSKVVPLLQARRASEWPALLGAAAFRVIGSNKAALPPSAALRILLEAAIPISKLDPATVVRSGIAVPPLTGWSNRAMQPASQQEIVAEIRAAMPVQAARPVTAASPLVITQPTISFVNLLGPDGAALLADDETTIGPLFRGNVQVEAMPAVRADVLFVYCAIERSGQVVGQALSLRDLIGRSGARVAVVASDIAPGVLMDPGFQKSLSRGNNPPVNLVLTGNRNGENFGRFFKSLFELMGAGLPMPSAWGKLVPQTPHQPSDVPGTICLMEAGPVVFGKTVPAA
jgi:hypothetical protein